MGPEILVSAAAGVTALGVLHRRLIKPAWQRLHALSDLVERELTPNGGGSMKDATHRIDDTVGDLQVQMAEHQARDDRFEEYVHERIHAIVNTLAYLRGRAGLAEEDPPPKT